ALALSPIRDTLIEGFSHFVTSMTAPIASGWSDIAGWDLHPLESAAFARRTPIADIAPLIRSPRRHGRVIDSLRAHRWCLDRQSARAPHQVSFERDVFRRA